MLKLMRNKILIFLLFLILSSCSTEQRIAYKYQNDIAQTPILIRNSAEVYLTNSKQYIPNNTTEIEYQQYLDTAYLNSDLIKHIDPNDFSNSFTTNFSNDIRSKKFKVYLPDSITNFIQQTKPKILVEVVQLEIIEFIDYFFQRSDATKGAINTNKYLHIAEANINISPEIILNTTYDIEIERNSLSVNLWLRINIYQEGGKYSSETVFMQYILHDKIEGDFVWENSEKVSFIYTIDSIGVSNLWKAEAYSAKKFTNNTIEYFINNIIENRVMEITNKHKKRHWEYRSQTGRILHTNKNGDYEIMNDE